MTRFQKGATLPVPPIMGQRSALLPDGRVDLAATTDCGEACMSSALEVLTTYRLSPGCIRQALGLALADGRTLGYQIGNYLTAMSLDSWALSQTSPEAWSTLAKLRHFGRYAIVLGTWIDPNALHWVLAYERSSDRVHVMEPWNGVYREIRMSDFSDLYAGTSVVLSYWNS